MNKEEMSHWQKLSSIENREEAEEQLMLAKLSGNFVDQIFLLHALEIINALEKR